jgi:serine/threonine-protein kinase
MAQNYADRNLLFGILALQLDFISRDQLISALHAWVLDKQKPLGEILVAQQVLAAPNREALELLVDRHLEHHGHQLHKSLASVSITPQVQQDLDAIADPDMHASLSSWPTAYTHDTGVQLVSDGTDRPRDASAAVGEPSSSGLRFRVLRLHAEGGLGRVSVACDRELSRDVALKEIKPEFADDAVAQDRFLCEAEITGGLEHPGVVPVYGLGRFADGRPFYAMRFIQGQSLKEGIDHFHATDWKDAEPGKRLLLRGLLRRFVDICNAVAYAHSRGILHRDLKPANVMLGPYGETLLVDWGLAKAQALEEGQTSPPEGFLRPSAGDRLSTQAGTVIGTPPYMAPEQAAGGAVGAAADVYGLGATLYHLLAGRAPFSGTDALDILTRVVQGQCRPAREVNPTVPAALSAVCQKAMALAPEDRYDSAKELAAEVERWLADEPVAAYREPWQQRLSRRGRRHRTLVASGMMLLLTGLVGLALGLWAVGLEQHKTAQERDQAKSNLQLAESNLQLAKQAVDECFGVAKEHPLLQGQEMKAVKKLLLEKALPFYENFQVQRPEDPALQEEMAGITYRVGYISSEIGRKPEAMNSYQEALRIYMHLTEKHPEVAKYEAQLASSHHNLGNLQSETGDLAGALHSFREALRIDAGLTEKHPDIMQYQADLANSHNSLGALQRKTGDRAAALRSYREALRIRTALPQMHPEITDYQAELAGSHGNLGNVQSETGDLPGALRSYREALRICTNLAEKHPEVIHYRAQLAKTQRSLGMLQRATGDRVGALRSCREAQRILTALVEKHPEVTEFQVELAGSHGNVGTLQREAGDRPGALHSCQEALRIQTALSEKHPEVLQYQSDLTASHSNVGNLQRETGDFPGALRSFKDALRIKTALSEKHPEVTEFQSDLANLHNSLGTLQSITGNRAAALRSFQEALRVQTGLTEKHPELTGYQIDLAGMRVNIGHLLCDEGKPQDSLAGYEQAITTLDLVRRRLPSDPTVRLFLRNAHIGHARALNQLGRHAGAAADWEQALMLDEGPQRSAYRISWADALARAGEHARATTQAAEFDRLTSVPGGDSYNLACVWSLSAAAARKDARLPAAQQAKLAGQYADRALAWLRKAREAGYFKDPATVANMKNDSDLDPLQGRQDFKKLIAELDQEKLKGK